MDNNNYEDNSGGSGQNDSLHRRLRLANAAAGITLMGNKSNTNSSDSNKQDSDDSGRNNGRGRKRNHRR